MTRTRTRGRPLEAPEAKQERPQRNERFDSKRSYSRTRNRTVENVQKEIPTARDSFIVRQRPQSFSRRTISTEPTIEVSSPTIDESKIEVVNSNLDDIPRVTPKIENVSATTFRRRNPPSSTESTAPRRRGRVNTRTDTRSLDLSVSGTTNTFTVSNREPSTPRTAAGLRNNKKLRYKTRLPETDTNLTGEGIIANEVTKSSQNKESDTSQPELQTPAPILVETTAQSSTEVVVVKTTTSTTTKPGTRPLPRGKVNFRPTVKLSKLTKTSDEIGEDDNYPASFKALIKAKNATVSIQFYINKISVQVQPLAQSHYELFIQIIKYFQTQASSPTSESLSVKASQKVYKTYSSSAQTTNTGPAKYNKYNTRVM